MSQPELLSKVLDALDDLAIPYMLTGSLVSSIQGVPRSTHDIDVVVRFPKEKASLFVRRFPGPDYYVSQDSIHDAIDTSTMFNLLEPDTGNKIDLWMLTNSPFDQSRFARRQPASYLQRQVWMSTPQDTILAKLRWSKLCGGSERQFRDALSVYECNTETMDDAYLTQWSMTLGVEEDLARIKREATKKP